MKAIFTTEYKLDNIRRCIDLAPKNLYANKTDALNVLDSAADCGWILTAERPPTEEDEDQRQEIIGLPEGGIYWERIRWYVVVSEANVYTRWQRVPYCLKAPGVI